MPVISGKSGAVNGRSTVREWSITPSAQAAAFVSSARGASGSGGMTGIVPGNTDWTGQYSFYGIDPGVYPGDSFTFTGATGDGTVYTGTALVSSMSLAAPVEEGGIINGTIQFAANSALSRAATPVNDTTVPAAYSPITVTAVWNSVTLANLRSWNFTINSALQTYTDAGVTKRVAGNLSANGSISLYEGDIQATLLEGEQYTLDCYVTASTYWRFTYATLVGKPHTIPIESGGIVAVQYDWQYSGYKRISGTMTKGTILKPGGSALWS
jgi:hypothetical protein